VDLELENEMLFYEKRRGTQDSQDRRSRIEGQRRPTQESKASSTQFDDQISSACSMIAPAGVLKALGDRMRRASDKTTSSLPHTDLSTQDVLD
jgi:hypothetical protein